MKKVIDNRSRFRAILGLAMYSSGFFFIFRDVK